MYRTSNVLPRSSRRAYAGDCANGLRRLSLVDIARALEDTGALPTESDAVPLKTCWANFISGWEFQWFCNFTFREKVHPEQADKQFRLWVARLDEANIGGSWHRPHKRKKRATWIRGLEWQKRGVLHYHALVGNLPPYRTSEIDRLVWMERWEKQTDICGFSRIFPVTEQFGVAEYISKYCAKGGEVDVSPWLEPGRSYVWRDPSLQVGADF